MGILLKLAAVVFTRVQVWGEFCQAGTGFHINIADGVLGGVTISTLNTSRTFQSGRYGEPHIPAEESVDERGWHPCGTWP